MSKNDQSSRVKLAVINKAQPVKTAASNKPTSLSKAERLALMRELLRERERERRP